MSKILSVLLTTTKKGENQRAPCVLITEVGCGNMQVGGSHHPNRWGPKPTFPVDLARALEPTLAAPSLPPRGFKNAGLQEMRSLKFGFLFG